MWLLIVQRLALDALLDLVRFPLWWYTGGLIRAAQFAGKNIAFGNSLFAPGLWLRNMFVPMYGQSDWQGRLVSFFIRLVNVIFRAAVLALWMVIVVAIALLWPAIPVAIVLLSLSLSM